MAKKKLDLNASMSATVDKIFTPAPAPHETAAHEEVAVKEEAPSATSTEEKKLGRPPKEPTMPLTVRLSPDLLHELKLRAVMEHTTQTAIIDTLLRKYLNM